MKEDGEHHGRRARVRVKICGVTTPADGVAAASAGADAVGLVFYPPSPRAVDRVRARSIAAALPPFVTVVGLFVDAGLDEVMQAAREVPLDLVQFHGDEGPEHCAAAGRPYLRAVKMRHDVDLAHEAARYAGARALLLDTYRADLPGGSGQRFDWTRATRLPGMPVVLAGGLAPENVAEAVRAVRPWAVDVSTGVERAPGVKDPGLIRAFIDEVQRVSAT